MKTRIRHTSLVIGFLGVDFETKYISKILKKEVQKRLQEFSFPPELDDWEIDFCVIYNNIDFVRLYKRTKSLTKEKYKEIVIHIPIPLKSVVSWGVNTNQLIELNYGKESEKYFNRIEIDPTHFEDRTSYILACMKRAIQECFELGFTVNRHRIKNGSKVKVR